MEDNEFVTSVTENVDEQTTEEIGVQEDQVDEIETDQEEQAEVPELKYSDTDVDDIVSKRVKRAKDKSAKEFEREMRDYREAEFLLNQAFGTNNIKEANGKIKEFYRNQGRTLEDYNPGTNDFDMEAGAEKEAQNIIDGGYEEIVEEVDRLASLGENLSPRQKIIYKNLSKERTRIEDLNTLQSLGVSEDEYNSKEFKDFCNKLNPNLSIEEKYELYHGSSKPKTNKIIGSQKSESTSNEREYFSDEEIEKLSKDQLADDKIWEKVRRSMTRKR